MGDDAAGPLLSSLPVDDTGADTQARFRFQADCAARDCFRMLTPDGPKAVVCEWHEDYVVVFADRPAELVSVKHRERNSGPWSLNELVSRGGLSHLMNRWLSFDRQPTPRLLTNGGLKPGPGEAARLREAVWSSDIAALETFAARISAAFGVAPSVLMQFLRALKMDHDLPHRDHIAAHHTTLLRAILKKQGMDELRDSECYGRLVDHVLRRSGREPLEPAMLLSLLAHPDAGRQAATLDQRLAQRTIDRGDVLSVLRDTIVAGTNPPLEVSTALRAKLEAGGLGPTALRRAQLLRAAWYAYASSDAGLDTDRLRRIRNTVHARAEDSESSTAFDPPYGRRMAVDLRSRLERDPDVIEERSDLNLDLLMGCAFQLTDECLVWWSPESDVDLR